jgi:hypothetical protein
LFLANTLTATNKPRIVYEVTEIDIWQAIFDSPSDAHLIRKGDSDKAMEVQSNENAALLNLLKTKSRTKTELLKVSSARRRARQAALDALLAEGKVIRIDRKYFANDPSGSVDQLIDAEAARLDAYMRSVPDATIRSGASFSRNITGSRSPSLVA